MVLLSLPYHRGRAGRRRVGKCSGRRNMLGIAWSAEEMEDLTGIEQRALPTPPRVRRDLQACEPGHFAVTKSFHVLSQPFVNSA